MQTIITEDGDIKLVVEETVKRCDFKSQLEDQKKTYLSSIEQITDRIAEIDDKLAIMDEAVKEGKAVDLRPVPVEEIDIIKE